MAIKLGTKVRINRHSHGASPDEMGTYATIIDYVDDKSERFFPQGAYYLNPPVGNNKQYSSNGKGWGISSGAFEVTEKNPEKILENTYFVITNFGDTNPLDRNDLSINTVYKQESIHPCITPENPASSSMTLPNFCFGYGEKAKKMNTRVRYANAGEIRLYRQGGRPIYIGNRIVSSLKIDHHIPIGHSSFWDGVATSDIDIVLDIDSDPVIRDAADLVIRDGVNAKVAMLTGSSGVPFVDAPESKEHRLAKLTQGITMTKSVVIPVKKKSIKRLV